MRQVTRGRLRIYLGSAAGVGKTYAMLGDARIALADGGDVVIGYLEPHDRPLTQEQAHGLEIAPVVDLTGRRADLGVDVEWLLQRQPTIALVDELAHTNVDGSRNHKRHDDIRQLLDGGIDVWTTVNIQHLESLNDRIQQLTGVAVRETFPDELLHGADEIRLIDISPSALRERINRGHVYSADRVETALAGFFSVRNLTALRALALHELAENAAAQLAELDPQAETRPNERILVAVGGNPRTSIRLIREGARLARRSQGQLIVVYVRPRGIQIDKTTQDQIGRSRTLTETLNGIFLERENDEPASEIISEARAHGATQIVLGATQRSRMKAAFSPGPIDAIMRESHGIALHIVPRPAPTETDHKD